MASKQSGWKVTGLEPDENAKRKAKELYQLSLGSSENLFSLPAESFDAITMWHVLEHVHQLHAYLKQLRKILKPGGNLFIAVPNYTSFDQHIYKEYWAAYDVPRHLYYFSPWAMNKLLSLHEMQLALRKPMWFDSFYVCMLSEQYKSGRSNFIKAILNGGVSNLKAYVDTGKCSSVIYVAH
jgi:predicted SAM-dependent methyltransferase